MWNAIIPGLIMFILYVVGVLILSGICAKIVEYFCPKLDDHKKYKITNVSTYSNSRNIHRP